MKAIVLQLFAVLLPTNVIASTGLTQICMHGGVSEELLKNPSESPFKEGAKTFGDMVKNGAFIDKTLLLEQVFEPEVSTQILITCPRRWGKTINLQMIDFFASMSVDQNGSMIDPKTTPAYKFFKYGEMEITSKAPIGCEKPITIRKLITPTLISKKNDVIDNHLSRYEVIHLDFSNLKVGDRDFEYFLDKFKLLLQVLFQQFWYVRDKLEQLEKYDKLARIDFEIFDAILKGRARETQSLRGVRFLCELLKDYFNRRVIIIVDEYDTPFADIFFNRKINHRSKDAYKVQHFVQTFFTTTFKSGGRSPKDKIKGENEPLYFRAIISGIARISKRSLFDGTNNLCEWSMIRDHDTFPFYGFTDSEINDVLKLMKIEKEKERLMLWYDGYRAFHHLNSPIYNPISTLGFLVNRTLSNYWLDTGLNTTILDKLMAQFQIRFELEPLLNLQIQRTVDMEYLEPPTMDNLEKLGDLVRGDYSSIVISGEVVESTIGLLLSLGYLSLSKSQPTVELKRSIGIPNKEVRHIFASTLKSHYKQRLAEHFNLLLRTSEVVEDFLNNDDEYSKEFESSIRVVLADSGLLKDFKKDRNQGEEAWIRRRLGFCHANEAAGYSALYKVLSYLQIEEKIALGADVTYSVESPLKKNRLFAYNKNRAIIIEMKYDKCTTVEQTLKQAEKYVLLLKDKMITFDAVKIVAIKVNNNKNVEIKTMIKRSKELKKYFEEWMKNEKNKTPQSHYVEAEETATTKNVVEQLLEDPRGTPLSNNIGTKPLNIIDWSAYQLFCQERFAKVKDIYPEMNISSISRFLSARWRSIKTEIKDKYRKLAKCKLVT